MPVWIDDNAIVGVFDIRARARRHHAAYGHLSLIVVDYLQALKASRTLSTSPIGGAGEVIAAPVPARQRGRRAGKGR